MEYFGVKKPRLCANYSKNLHLAFSKMQTFQPTKRFAGEKPNFFIHSNNIQLSMSAQKCLLE